MGELTSIPGDKSRVGQRKARPVPGARLVRPGGLWVCAIINVSYLKKEKNFAASRGFSELRTRFEPQTCHFLLEILLTQVLVLSKIHTWLELKPLVTEL